MTRWGMVIDLRKCIGCETCKHICDSVHDGGWRRVIESKMKDDPNGQRTFISMACMHCEAPPCLEVCPTGATLKRADGIVTIDHSRCIGCSACILACPYKARKINMEDDLVEETVAQTKDFGQGQPDRIGVCSKCDFCASLIDEGLKKGLQPGTDEDATPLCVRNCLAEAIHFGDLDDPDSNVAKLIRQNTTVQSNKALGTEPSVFYILENN